MYNFQLKICSGITCFESLYTNGYTSDFVCKKVQAFVPICDIFCHQFS